MCIPSWRAATGFERYVNPHWLCVLLQAVPEALYSHSLLMPPGRDLSAAVLNSSLCSSDLTHHVLRQGCSEYWSNGWNVFDIINYTCMFGAFGCRYLGRCLPRFMISCHQFKSRPLLWGKCRPSWSAEVEMLWPSIRLSTNSALSHRWSLSLYCTPLCSGFECRRRNISAS